jgi:large subunit ribosomal protein L25
MPTVIAAQLRTPGGKNVNRRLRLAGKIPAVIYGPGKQPIVVSVDPHEVSTILHSDTGRNTIFSISVDGVEQSNAMVKDYQRIRFTAILSHRFPRNRNGSCSSYRQRGNGRRTEVKLDGGIRTSSHAPSWSSVYRYSESIKVDISHLKINDYIRVKNLQTDAKVKILQTGSGRRNHRSSDQGRGTGGSGRGSR